MFTLGCRGIHAMTLNLDWFQSSSSTATFSIIASIILQSSLFAFLHLHSPGSTYVSLINLFVGGVAASINVMVSGGSIWLGVGWHFGWNICMGHEAPLVSQCLVRALMWYHDQANVSKSFMEEPSVQSKESWLPWHIYWAF